MAWPSDQDYNEAIQNPQIAFADPELQSGKVEANAMGIPKARSGNFATVYKVTVNGASHAVRCFRYDNPEHKIRYPAIASYLTQHSLPYMVSFRYMSEGIRIGPSRYPFVRMRWVEGDSLLTYIEKNLSSPKTLRDLATAWAQMLFDLREAKIAHGDLQHGNVLVVQGKLRLVDYDGMYIPALNGSRGIELGHRNYQHPQRTELDFGPHLDNFSAWLIYVSLIALASEPALWRQLKAGDECLLFRKEDFDASERSAAFRLLKGLPDGQVRRLTQRLEHFLWLPPDQVPPIDNSQDASTESASSYTSHPPVTNWICDYTKQFADASSSEFSDIDVGDQTWLHDHVEQKIDLGSFANNVVIDRMIALLLFVSAGAFCAWFSHGVTPLVAILGWVSGISAATLATIAGWLIRYRTESFFPVIHSLRSELAIARKDRETAKLVLEELKVKRLRRRATFIEDGARLNKLELSLQAEEEKRLGDIHAVLKTALEQTTARRRTYATEEGAEKRRLTESLGKELSALSHAVSRLPDQERQELARLESETGGKIKALAAELQQAISRRDAEFGTALRAYQDQVANDYLQKIKLWDARIPGIGPQLKQRLAEAGFVSARDIGTRGAGATNIVRIGEKKWIALHMWKQSIEGPFRLREAPKSLPSYQIYGIEQRYPQIKALQQNLTQEQAGLGPAKQSVKAAIADQKLILEQRKTVAEENFRQQAACIGKKFNDLRKQITDDEEAANVQYRKDIDDPRTEFGPASARLVEEGIQVKNAYKRSLDQFSKEIEAVAKRVSETEWRSYQSECRHLSSVSLSFRQYSLRVLRRS